MRTFSQFCVVLVTMTISVTANGIVISNMWNWFIVPLGVIPIGFWLAVGISLTVCLFTAWHNDNTQQKELSKAVASNLANIIAKFTVLGLGAIVRLFI